MVDLARLAPGPIGPLAGMEYVRQRGMEGQQRGQQNALSRLAGQAYTAPQADRQAIFGQMAQVNPQAALEAEQTFAKRDDDAIGRIAAKARYVVGLHKAGQGAAAAPAYASLVQDARALNLGDIPEQWDDSFIPGLEQLAQYNSDPTRGIGVQSTYVDDQGNRIAIMRDGSTQVLGRNNASIRVLEPEGAVPYGVVTSGGRAGEMIGIGASASQATTPTAPAQPLPAGQLFAGLSLKYGIRPTSVQRTPQRNADVGGVPNSFHLSGQAADWVVPQHMKASFIADAQANGYEAIDEGDHIHIEPRGQRPERQPPVFDPINGGLMQPPRTPTAAEKAGAAERAKLEAQLSYAPEIAASEAEAARLKKEAEAAAERNAATDKRTAQTQETIDTLNEAISILPRATSGRLEAIGSAVAGAAGMSTSGAQATAQLRLLAAKLIANVPRFEGPQSNIDVQFYREAAGDLANENLPAQTRLAAARKMLEISQRYVGQPAKEQGGAWGIQRVK